MQQDDLPIVNIDGAAAILSAKRGLPVSAGYIRQLRRRGMIKAINEPQEGDGRKPHSLIFHRADVEAIDIGPPKVRGVRTPRTPRPYKKQ